MPDPAGNSGAIGIITVPTGHPNSFLILGARPILIDTGLPGSSGAILSALKEHSVDPRDLALIIITHAHIDHTGSVAALKEATGAPVLIHTRDAGYLRNGESAPAKPNALLGRLLRLLIGRKKLDPSLAVEPDIIIDGEYPLDAFGIPGRIIPTPGHTSGSISVILPGTACICGDLIMGMLPPSRPRISIFAEDPGEVIRSIRTILDTSTPVIYTGHGGPFTPQSLEELIR
jgi:glyoxylase-like metal-dependent hydrolase (beta-lactamase superfamily II)